MKITKVLVYVEPKEPIDFISKFTIDLVRPYNAKIIALSIIQRNIQKTKTEDSAWQKLYELEEDAFEAGVKISLLLEEIETRRHNNLTNKILSLTRTFQPDILILSNLAQLNLKKFIHEIRLPIIFVPHQQNKNE